ncbi:MAG: PD40 domain-containing protein [Lentisphaeria bacterium]|nr:hypothetical protein [Lentisphaeria bacterium]NQZ68954.1 PD40 domain-containing protein [Lentisphaeria bacterium]
MYKSILLAIMFVAVIGCQSRDEETVRGVLNIDWQHSFDQDENEILIAHHYVEAAEFYENAAAHALFQSDMLINGFHYSSDQSFLIALSDEEKNSLIAMTHGKQSTIIQSGHFIHKIHRLSSGNLLYVERIQDDYSKTGHPDYLKLYNTDSRISRILEPVYMYTSNFHESKNKNLIFASIENRHADAVIWIIDETGSQTNFVRKGTDPVFSGDNYIFAKKSKSGKSCIWEMNQDGSRLKKIIGNPDGNCFSPIVDPQNKYIAYVLEGSSEEQSNIHLYERSSGKSRQITHYSYRDDMPQFSADGKSLIFRSSRNMQWGLWKIAIK